MLQPLPALALGFALGMSHATDADHVAAVTAIVSRERAVGRAASIGMLWGAGHMATVLLVGGTIVLFNLVVPPRLGLALEFAVAMMLIAIGVLALRPLAPPTAPPVARWRPVGVGFVHGLAGSAFVAMLVLKTIASPLVGVAYLVVFGLGTIAGMALVTMAIAVPSALASRRMAALHRPIRIGAAGVSILVGVLLAHEVGISGGLFSAHPVWTPR